MICRRFKEPQIKHIFQKQNKIHLPPEFKLNSGVQRKAFLLANSVGVC